MPDNKKTNLWEWTPAELIWRAQHRYAQTPTPENRKHLTEILEQTSGEANTRLFKIAEQGGSYEDAYFFPDAYPLTIVPHPRYCPVNWHTHDFFEMIYVCRGGCENLLQGRTLHMYQGDFCILPPNQPHALQCFRDDGFILNILIRKTAFQQSFKPLLSDFGPLSDFFSHTLFQKDNNAYLLFRCGEDGVIRARIHDLCEEFMSSRPFSASILTGHLILLLGHLMRSHQFNTIQITGKGNDRPTQVSRMLQYISDHLRTVTLGELAQEFNYSSSRCSSIIKDATGKTFTKFLRELKAHQAAQLLRDSKKSMTQIAEIVGFCDPSHFYRTFSAVYGKTPMQYRKDFQGKTTP